MVVSWRLIELGRSPRPPARFRTLLEPSRFKLTFGSGSSEVHLDGGATGRPRLERRSDVPGQLRAAPATVPLNAGRVSGTVACSQGFRSVCRASVKLAPDLRGECIDVTVELVV